MNFVKQIVRRTFFTLGATTFLSLGWTEGGWRHLAGRGPEWGRLGWLWRWITPQKPSAADVLKGISNLFLSPVRVRTNDVSLGFLTRWVLNVKWSLVPSWTLQPRDLWATPIRTTLEPNLLLRRSHLTWIKCSSWWVCSPTEAEFFAVADDCPNSVFAL